MTAEQFDQLLERRLLLTRAVLGAKAGEYASKDDRLHNFKRAAGLRSLAMDEGHLTPQDALLGMLVKHWVAVEDMARSGLLHGASPGRARVDEKIGDAINYLILLEAVLTEPLVMRGGEG